MYSVYKITNAVNGKAYIGITSRSTDERFNDHLSRSRNDARFSRLYLAMRKYGVENFSVETLEQSDDSDKTRNLETVYIKKFDCFKNGYNCNYGGHGAIDISDETRRRISQSNLGRKVGKEGRKNMSLSKLGNKECAKNFKDYINKGSSNPLSKYYRIQFPDGRVKTICGIRDFCRNQNISYCKLNSGTFRTKGYILLERLNDYPEREYTQASGSAHLPMR